MRDFLDWLWKAGVENLQYGELRCISPFGRVSYQSWFSLRDETHLLLSQAVSRDWDGDEVYVGVLPRIRRGGTSEDVTSFTDLIWTDVDAKHHGGSKKAALDALLDFPVAPSVIVDSGHGFHAYWRLDHSYLFDDVQPIMKGIARRIGGDAVYDRARILRLPGLSNHKGGGNAPVRLIRFDTTSSFLLSDLDEYAYREPRPTYRVVHDIPQSALGWANYRSGNLAVLDLDFDPGKGARSEHDFAVVCSLIEAGYTDDSIIRTFLSHPLGVGAKTVKSGLRYLERTIAKAHAAVGR